MTSPSDAYFGDCDRLFRDNRVCKIFCVSGCLLITAVNGHHT